MKIIITLQKDDITTCINGKNILLNVSDNLKITFTEDAITELIADVQDMHEQNLYPVKDEEQSLKPEK